MDGAHLDTFQGGFLSSGLTSIQPTITCIPSYGPIGPGPSGPVITTHSVVGSLLVPFEPPLSQLVCLIYLGAVALPCRF